MQSYAFPKEKKHLSSPLESLSINWKENQNIKRWISNCYKIQKTIFVYVKLV